MACEMGTRGAPKAPCRMRYSTSASKLSARPHRTDVVVKPKVPINIIRRRPKRFDSQPDMGVTTAVATRLKVITQAT